MCSAWRFCLSVYALLSPRGIDTPPDVGMSGYTAKNGPEARPVRCDNRAGDGGDVMGAERARVVEAVDPERLGELGLELCRVRSYTGDTREATERFVAAARAAGLELTLFDDYPATPAVVARLPGRGGGPSLELNAHIDTVPLEHGPARLVDG